MPVRIRPGSGQRPKRRSRGARPLLPDNSSRRRRPATLRTAAVRTIIVAATIAAVAASPSAVADLTSPTPPPISAPSEAPASQPPPPPPPPEEPVPPAIPVTRDPCAVAPELCGPVVAPTLQEARVDDGAGVSSCATTGRPEPTGSLSIVPVTGPQPTDVAATADGVRFRVEIEDGLAIAATCFVDTVAAILSDDRSWGGSAVGGFTRVDDDSFDFRLVLASPDTTNALCYPAATGGKYSCRNQDKVVLNLMRWETGAEDFGDDMDTYRQYLVNHEVGHFLGKGHRSCPGPGQPAPVMMQQTKTVADCIPNGRPTTDER